MTNWLFLPRTVRSHSLETFYLKLQLCIPVATVTFTEFPTLPTPLFCVCVISLALSSREWFSKTELRHLLIFRMIESEIPCGCGGAQLAGHTAMPVDLTVSQEVPSRSQTSQPLQVEFLESNRCAVADRSPPREVSCHLLQAATSLLKGIHRTFRCRKTPCERRTDRRAANRRPSICSPEHNTFLVQMT